LPCLREKVFNEENKTQSRILRKKGTVKEPEKYVKRKFYKQSKLQASQARHREYSKEYGACQSDELGS